MVIIRYICRCIYTYYTPAHREYEAYEEKKTCPFTPHPKPRHTAPD